MSTTRTTVDDLLKEFYLEGVRNQLNNDIFLLSQIERGSEDVEGRETVLSLKVRRNSGVGARAESGTLPTAGNQGYVDQRVGLHYNYGKIKVSGPLIRSGRTDRGSFARPIESELDGVTTDLKKDVNRQIYGTSDGVIASTLVTSNSSTIVVSLSRVQQDQIQEGMLIDVGTVAAPTTVASGLEVTAVTSSTVVVATTAITTNSTTHKIFRSGSGGSGSAQKEITGLRTIVSSGDEVFNVNGATYSAWNSYVDSNSGTLRPVSETLFTEAQHEVNRRSGSEIDLWVTSDGVHRKVSALLTSMKRFPNTNELKGGYSGLDMSAAGSGRSGGAAVSLTWDVDCPNHTAFGLNTGKLKWHHAGETWDWMEEDGAVLSRSANEDAYEAVLFNYSELATDQRNAHCRIADLQE